MSRKLKKYVMMTLVTYCSTCYIFFMEDCHQGTNKTVGSGHICSGCYSTWRIKVQNLGYMVIMSLGNQNCEGGGGVTGYKERG
jgi:hypothetical protein